MSCDVGKKTEGLENEVWRRWSDGKVGEWAELIVNSHSRAHSPTFPSLHLHHSSFSNHSVCHSSFSNPSLASPMSQVLHLIHLASRPCGKFPSDTEPRPMCYEASVVWHSWQQHKFFLVSLPYHVLVSCRPGTYKHPHEKIRCVEKTVTENTYLDMSQQNAVPQLPDGIIYQLDGAPPHFDNIVRNYFYEQFHAKWIGRGSPYITWPATSPYLIPHDLFPCGGLLGTRSTGYQYLIWQT